MAFSGDHMAAAEKSSDNQLFLIIGLFIINVFWGGSFIANAIALKSIGPIEIAALRFFIAAPLLALVTLAWKGKEIFRIDLKDLGILIIMALTGVTLQYVIQVTAQNYTTAINASLLINTSVFFILFLSAMFLSEKLSLNKILGAVIGFGGVALLVSGGDLSLDLGSHAIGDLMILVCAMLWSVYSIYGKKIATKYHPLTVLNYLFILGTIGILPFYLLTPHQNPATIPLPVIGAIIFLSIFCSIIAYLVYNIALEKMEASRVAVFIYLVPMSTIVLAWLILGESMTIPSIIGGIAVCAGMYIAERK